MTLAEAFLLGWVQGLTEFLPVSSSAHLVLVQHLLGFKEPLVFFDVVLHLGTLAGLFVYFWADIAHLVRDSLYGISYLLHRKPMAQIAEIVPHSRWALGILVASLPTGLMGILFKDWFESLFGSLQAVGIALWGTSAILWLTRYHQKDERSMSEAKYLDFFFIGFFQGIAIIPGISRSGATIAASLFRGFKREEAFRFSFLLAIPAILGAGLLEFQEGVAQWQWGWPVLVGGFVASAVFGYLSLFFLDRVTRKGRLHYFAFYTFLVGALILYFVPRLE